MLRLPNIMIALEGASRRNYAHIANLKNKKPETHYEVLNVRNDCSTRDIRNAYLKLSKEFHPDVKRNADNVERTARFVQITEAYQTLVKSTSRRDYDDSLMWFPAGTREPIQPWDVKPNYNPDPGPYYGIRGLKRVSNWKVALVLMSLGILGAIFGFSSVKHSFELDRKVKDEISAVANTHHAAVVADAQKYGNEEQIRRMVERLARDPLAKAAAK